MFTLSPIKIMVIITVVLVLLGPDKIPDVAHRLGKLWRGFKRMQERIESEVRESLPDLPSTGDLARIARNPVNLLNTLADRADARDGSNETGALNPEAPASPTPTDEASVPLPVRREDRPSSDVPAANDPSLN
jgi:TatA/E family protein of Tat protein translocase